jgi:choice-of-anchor B domain-containing protein
MFANGLFAQDSMNVSLLFHWDDNTIPAEPVYGLNYNEVWGVALNGREYAVIGSSKGTHIFDVTDPANSTEVAYVEGAAQGVIHRDYKDYQGYLYAVADEGPSTLQIIDLNNLPNSASVVYDTNELITRAHNIFIDTLNGLLYDTNGGVYSLANPEDPQTVAFVNLGGMMDHGHDMYVRDDTVYWHGGPTGMHVYDYSVNPNNPTLLGELSLGEYNHSGWLSEDGDTYVFAEEDFGRDIQICDVSDLSNINIVSYVNSGFGSASIPHNLILKDDILYVSYYHDGLYIFDLSDPANPWLRGFYDTEPALTQPYTWFGAWGVYPLLPSGNILVSDTRHGLFVFDASQATSSIPELPSLNSDKELVKTVDLTGREVEGRSSAILINVYSDGSTEKVVRTE